MKVNEIFYSLQGEGYHMGEAAIFVRFSGCNLKCYFCDTDFHNYEELSVEEIVDRVKRESSVCKFVILTGGEPTLQNGLPQLIDKLHESGYYVAIESNGTYMPPANIDWLTISPKTNWSAVDVVVKKCNEIKCVFDNYHEPDCAGIKADHYYLQPCDHGDEKGKKVIQLMCVEYIKKHPQWKLSLQTQKILKVR